MQSELESDDLTTLTYEVILNFEFDVNLDVNPQI